MAPDHLESVWTPDAYMVQRACLASRRGPGLTHLQGRLAHGVADAVCEDQGCGIAACGGLLPPAHHTTARGHVDHRLHGALEKQGQEGSRHQQGPQRIHPEAVLYGLRRPGEGRTVPINACRLQVDTCT